jgi:hypothetical protein
LVEGEINDPAIVINNGVVWFKPNGFSILDNSIVISSLVRRVPSPAKGLIRFRAGATRW